MTDNYEEVTNLSVNKLRVRDSYDGPVDTEVADHIVEVGDDLASIVNDASAGETVIISAGTHTYSTALAPAAGIRLFGKGIAATTLSYTGSDTAAIDVSGLQNSMAGFRLQNDGTANYGFDISTSSRSHYQNLEIDAFDVVAMYANDAISNHFEHCRFTGSTQHGVHLETVSFANDFVNCDFENNTQHGMWVQDISNLNLTGCVFEDNGKRGLSIYASAASNDGINVTGCHFEGNDSTSAGNQDIQLAANSSSVKNGGINIAGNFFLAGTSTSRSAIDLRGGNEGVSIMGNSFNDFANGIVDSIQDTVGPDGIIVSGNRFDGVTTAIDLGDSTNTVTTANHT